MAAPMLTSEELIDINELHCLLDHALEDKARAVSKHHGIKVIDKFNTCSACAEAKARQLNILKEIPTGSKSTIVDERLHMDISSIKARSFGGAKSWLLVMDDASGYCFLFFLRRKKDTPMTIVQLIKHLWSKGKQMKKIRCDNAGANKKNDALCQAVSSP